MKYQLKPSRTLQFFIVFCHALAIIALALLDCGWLLKVPFILLLIYLLHRSLKRYVFLQTAESIIAFTALSSGLWKLFLNANKVIEVELLDQSYHSQFLIVLLFNDCRKNKKYSLTVLPDSLDADDFRQLHVDLNVLKYRNNSHTT